MIAAITPDMRIVEATAEHLPTIAGIYADVVTSSPATFDLEPPDLEAWRRSLDACDPERGRFLVVALDDGGAVLGYAKSGPFRERAAYDLTCETSIYLAPPARGQGVSGPLYAHLLELLDASPLRLAVGIVTEPNPASVALHEALGFERVGTLDGAGIKFGQPWSVTLYQRSLL
jgi:phosphinothricin acetyltransferase